MNIAPPQQFTLPFLRKEQLSSDAYSFFFDNSHRKIAYLPGQYIRMFLNIDQPDERGNSRFFSIVTSPTNPREIAITTRVIQSAFKKTLLTLQPGQEVGFFGPNGRFILDEEDKTPRIFLAGGIGITPFHSMILYASEKQLDIPVTFFVSFSTTEEAIYYQELTDASSKNPNIKIVYTITHPEDLQIKWNGEAGRISEELIKKYVQDTRKCLIYIAGPPKMVEAMEEIAQSLGGEKEHIKKESFAGY